MTVNLSALAGAGQQFFDNNGNPLSGGKLWSYQAGTTTPQTTYTTAAGNVAHTNPIIFDSAGRVSTGEIWLTAGSNYKFVLMTSADVTLATWDNITGINGTGIATNATNVAYDAPYTNSVERSVAAKLSDVISVKDFGAVGDGATDDTAAIARAAAALQDNQTLLFPSGTYLVSSTGATNEDAYGKKVMYLSGKRDIQISGETATIKCVNHNIATNGGLMFLWVESSQRVKVNGLRFDMSFTGVKNSSSFYPFVGAIVFNDAPSGSKTYDTLNNDVTVEDCSFKLFHPYGQFARTTAGNAYLGDSNNGYKMFSVYVWGDYLATTTATQNSGLTVSNVTFENGHNGYGVWASAWNDVVVDSVTAKAWVGKNSFNDGSFAGGGLPMVRYSQYQHNGINVTNCHFTAKPCSERLNAGFEGSASFFYIVDAGPPSLPRFIVTDNTVILGNGDAANSVYDDGVTNASYGYLIVSNNQFDGITDTTNAAGDGAYVNIVGSGDGFATLTVTSNTFGGASSYVNGIRVVNGASTSAGDRKLKSLIVTDNSSISQLQYFLDTNGGGVVETYEGVAYTLVENNTVIGTFNTVFDKTVPQSYAYRFAANQSTDVLKFINNITVDKYSNVNTLPSSINAAATVTSDGNTINGVTLAYSGTGITDYQTVNGSFNPILKGTSTAGSPVYSYTPVGRFFRVGNYCYFNVSIQISSAGGALGTWDLDLNDIPYTAANTANLTYSSNCVYDNLAVGAGKQLGFGIRPGTKLGYLYAMDQAGGALSALGIASDSAFQIIISGFYEIA